MQDNTRKYFCKNNFTLINSFLSESFRCSCFMLIWDLFWCYITRMHMIPIPKALTTLSKAGEMRATRYHQRHWKFSSLCRQEKFHNSKILLWFAYLCLLIVRKSSKATSDITLAYQNLKIHSLSPMRSTTWYFLNIRGSTVLHKNENRKHLLKTRNIFAICSKHDKQRGRTLPQHPQTYGRVNHPVL